MSLSMFQQGGGVSQNHQKRGCACRMEKNAWKRLLVNIHNVSAFSWGSKSCVADFLAGMNWNRDDGSSCHACTTPAYI